MIIKHPIKIPSAILAIIQQTRQHHIHLFRNELYEYQLKVDSHNLNANEGEEYWYIFTDFENQINGINKAFSNCLVKNNTLEYKVYRQDIVIQNGKKVVEEIMFWPVIYDVVSDIYVEDVPYFPMQRIMLNDTKIEIYAFPWFDCTIEIYPNASPILGLLELWFQKWYYPRGQ
jgi:hypothetical protein